MINKNGVIKHNFWFEWKQLHHFCLSVTATHQCRWALLVSTPFEFWIGMRGVAFTLFWRSYRLPSRCVVRSIFMNRFVIDSIMKSINQRFTWIVQLNGSISKLRIDINYKLYQQYFLWFPLHWGKGNCGLLVTKI